MFIVFEGVDGTGKSTQLKKCQTWLQQLGHSVVVCHDPGSTALGSCLRQLLLQHQDIPMDPQAEMFLFMAARAQMVTEVIRPALERHDVVLCDRFLLSTVVYQGHAGALTPQQIWKIGAVAIQGCLPDLTLVMDAPLHVAMQRLGTNRDRMESRGEDYFASVQKGFLKEAARDQRIRVIDASGEADDIHHQVCAAIQPYLRPHPAEPRS